MIKIILYCRNLVKYSKTVFEDSAAFSFLSSFACIKVNIIELKNVFKIYICVCGAPGSQRTTAVLSHSVRFIDGNQVISLGGKCPSLLSYPAHPEKLSAYSLLPTKECV